MTINLDQEQSSDKDSQPYTLTESIISRCYEFYINQEIKSPEYYSGLLALLRNVTENDIVKMYINCPGGDLHTGSQIIAAMKDSSAYIITILDGHAGSLAPLLLFSGDSTIVNDNSIIMFHDFSYGDYGKGNEMIRSASAYNKFYRKMLIDIVHPFLSEEEIDDIVSGKDMYIETEDIRDRLARLEKDENDIDDIKSCIDKPINIDDRQLEFEM